MSLRHKFHRVMQGLKMATGFKWIMHAGICMRRRTLQRDVTAFIAKKKLKKHQFAVDEIVLGTCFSVPVCC